MLFPKQYQFRHQGNATDRRSGLFHPYPLLYLLRMGAQLSRHHHPGSNNLHGADSEYGGGEARRLEWHGVGIEFSRIADRLFNGFTMQDGFSIATPEKALLDTIYLRKGLPVRDELELAGIDNELLRKMAEDYPKRVGDEVIA